MVDRGFNIQDDLTPLGMKVNIPPFLKGKTQLEPEELVEKCHIALLRIHVKRVVERTNTTTLLMEPSRLHCLIQQKKRFLYVLTCAILCPLFVHKVYNGNVIITRTFVILQTAYVTTKHIMVNILGIV